MHAAAGHPHRARRHDQPRRGGRARHGPALRLAAPARWRSTTRRSSMRVGGHEIAEGDVITIDGASGEVMLGEVPTVQPELVGDFGTLMAWADAKRRLRVRANAETPARLPHRARVRRRGDRPVPHRAYVLRCRADRERPPDDPRRGRGRPPRRARRSAPRPARRFRRDLPDHGRAAGHHPPARSAAARIPAAQRGGDRRGRRGGRRRASRRCSAGSPSCTSSTRCSAIAAAGSASPIPKSTRCRPAPSSRRRLDVAGEGEAPIPEVMVPLVATRAELAHHPRADRAHRRDGVRGARAPASTIWSAR